MKDNELFQKTIRFAFLVLLIFAFIGFAEKVRQNLMPEDSSAIFGGQLETGYDFAGYVISDKGDGNLEICGTAILNSSTAITAAHCVDDDTPVFIGLGQFSADSKNHYQVSKVEIHPNWFQGQSISSDVAILTLKEPIVLREYAEISQPSTGCNFKVVGYGRQDNTNNYYPTRKSATLCIESTDFNDGSISFVGETGGLCFGDSGSPVFKEGTNVIVTVASRIDSCYTNNFGAGSDLSEQFNKVKSVKAQDSNNSTELEKCGSIDSNLDGILNSLDLSFFASLYGKKCNNTQTFICGSKDSDKDGDIDLIDFSNFAKKYPKGKCS